MSEPKPTVDITETDELGLTRSGRAVSIAAWVLSALVIVVGIIMLVTTGRKLFILFIVLGILTPLNVLAYDNFVLKPKIAKLKRERLADRDQTADDAAAAKEEDA